jgi:hypothetical protein
VAHCLGPFLSKDDLCQYFPYEDYSEKFKRKMLIAEGAFGSVSMGEDLTSQYGLVIVMIRFDFLLLLVTALFDFPEKFFFFVVILFYFFWIGFESSSSID